MEIKFTMVRGDVTPDMKEYALKKVRKATRHIEKGVTDAHVQLGFAHSGSAGCIAESFISVKSHGKMIAKARASNMFVAIDEMIGKLDRQVRDLKEKRAGNRKRASQRMRAAKIDEAIDSAFSGPSDEIEE